MLKAGQLDLVAFDIKYAEDLLELWSDFEVIKYTYNPQIQSLDECIERIKVFISYTDKEIMNNFIILLENRAIGIVGSPIIDKSQGIFGLYYQIARKYWGHGYASQAITAFKQHIENQFPNARFQAEVVAENGASIAILSKAGLKEVAIEKGGFKLNGFHLDLIKFTN